MANDLLADAFDRVLESALAAIEGLDAAALAHRPAADANPIGWLVWHLTRVQDDHISDARVAGGEQVWTADGWAGRFGLPYDDDTIGYGQSSDEVAAASWDADLLAGYLRAVHDRTLGYLTTVTAEDLDRVVDEGWDPPVTLGVRLVSVVDDDIQHAGQAAYVRGLLA